MGHYRWDFDGCDGGAKGCWLIPFPPSTDICAANSGSPVLGGKTCWNQLVPGAFSGQNVLTRESWETFRADLGAVEGWHEGPKGCW